MGNVLIVKRYVKCRVSQEQVEVEDCKVCEHCEKDATDVIICNYESKEFEVKK